MSVYVYAPLITAVIFILIADFVSIFIYVINETVPPYIWIKVFVLFVAIPVFVDLIVYGNYHYPGAF